jgi:integrase
MRLHEICALNIANLRQLPVITWTGKGHKPRKTTAGQGFIDALGHYLDEYRRHVPELTGETPLLCKQVNGTHGHRRIRWGSCLGTDTLFYIVVHRAEAAGLGHVAPHDLRRTAAGILHRATDEHGAHHFDLLDIQKVLGHSDPATTMRSYLEPMNTDVLDRASRFLD